MKDEIAKKSIIGELGAISILVNDIYDKVFDPIPLKEANPVQVAASKIDKAIEMAKDIEIRLREILSSLNIE